MTAAIERATPPYAGVLAAIHQAAFPPREAWGQDAIALQLALPGTFGLFDPAGAMLMGRVAAGDAELLTLAVTPPMRRRGLAKALVHAAMDEARILGAHTMFLEVSTGNAAAQTLYASAGFTRIGCRRRYYADGSDALVLSARL